MLVLGLDMSSRTKLKVLGLGLDIEVLDLRLECSVIVNMQIMKLPATTVS